MGGGGGNNKIEPTADQTTNQQNNAKLWNHYVENYKPLVDHYAAQTVDTSRQSQLEKKVAGQVNADVMRTVDPGQMTNNAAANAIAMSRAAEVGTGAQVQGQGGARSRSLGEVQNVIDIGRGQETTAQAGIGEIATQSLRSEISNRESQQMEQAAVEDSYGSMAGAVAAGLVNTKRATTPKAGTLDLGGWTAPTSPVGGR